jgi:putative alpha-1,2-mannosidase
MNNNLQRNGTMVALVCAVNLSTSACLPAADEVAQWVDPRIGTQNGGNVIIGPSLPFGMVKPGPDKVNAAPPIRAGILQQSGSLTLSWSGGVSAYQVQMATNLFNPDWLNVGGVIGTNVVLTQSNSAAFYRVVGQ